jgi:hypothetical protein
VAGAKRGSARDGQTEAFRSRLRQAPRSWTGDLVVLRRLALDIARAGQLLATGCRPCEQGIARNASHAVWRPAHHANVIRRALFRAMSRHP